MGRKDACEIQAGPYGKTPLITGTHNLNNNNGGIMRTNPGRFVLTGCALVK
jgi:hypothetical protein